MGMKENHGITGLNSWTIDSLIKNYLAGNCDFYLFKHTARYFHQFGMLGEVVLDEVEMVSKSSTSGMACMPKQTKPDLEFMDSMAIFVYEELFLLNLFYQPSGRDILKRHSMLSKARPLCICCLLVHLLSKTYLITQWSSMGALMIEGRSIPKM
jgi:hypothetical protein